MTQHSCFAFVVVVAAAVTNVAAVVLVLVVKSLHDAERGRKVGK